MEAARRHPDPLLVELASQVLVDRVAPVGKNIGEEPERPSPPGCPVLCHADRSALSVLVGAVEHPLALLPGRSLDKLADVLAATAGAHCMDGLPQRWTPDPAMVGLGGVHLQCTAPLTHLPSSCLGPAEGYCAFLQRAPTSTRAQLISMSGALEWIYERREVPDKEGTGQVPCWAGRRSRMPIASCFR